MLADITFSLDQLLAYTPYMIGTLIMSYVMYKLGRPVAKGVGNLCTTASKATPITLLAAALFSGPMGASLLSEQYGSYGEMSALLPAGGIALYALISQLRSWAGAGQVSKIALNKAASKLHEALEEMNLDYKNHSGTKYVAQIKDARELIIRKA